MMMIPRRHSFDLLDDMFGDSFFNEGESKLMKTDIKEKKDKYVFFSEEMAKELRRWLQYRDRYKESEFLFCTIKGKELKERSFESNFTKSDLSLQPAFLKKLFL